MHYFTLRSGREVIKELRGTDQVGVKLWRIVERLNERISLSLSLHTHSASALRITSEYPESVKSDSAYSIQNVIGGPV